MEPVSGFVFGIMWWFCCGTGSDRDQNCSLVVITFVEEGGYVFTSVCLSPCFSVRRISCERILTKFLGGIGHGPGTGSINQASHRSSDDLNNVFREIQHVGQCLVN